MVLRSFAAVAFALCFRFPAVLLNSSPAREALLFGVRHKPVYDRADSYDFVA